MEAKLKCNSCDKDYIRVFSDTSPDREGCVWFESHEGKNKVQILVKLSDLLYVLNNFGGNG